MRVPGRCKSCGRIVYESDLCDRPDCDANRPEQSRGPDALVDDEPADPRSDEDMVLLGADNWWGGR